ncbi:MAG: SufD family Fe-S cluster assembly protein [Bacilli bacterium]|nr:SufD family Fe-S cluster assembly protein [Bacilli bacterium]
MKELFLKDISNTFTVEENQKLFIDNFDGEKSFSVTVNSDVESQLSLLSLEGFSGNIDIKVNTNSRLEIFYADLAKNSSNVKVNISLDEGSGVVFHLASLTTGTSNKNFTISVDHNAKNSTSFVDNYGVVKENGKLIFDGVSYIKNGCVKSVTRQNAKIMVFDEKSIGIAKPILKIDENDIQASHGAVVGKISDEHLFYLMSRGLSEEKAKVLITYGYLKPIMNGFDESTQQKIEELIEGRM